MANPTNRRNPRHYERRLAYHAAVETGWHGEKSVKQMEAELGISRQMVRSCLNDLGLPPRSAREANLIRMVRLSPEDRRRLARAANMKTRNAGRQPEVRHKAAVSRQATGTHIGRYEPEVIEYLIAEGFEVVPQFAWRRYNLDLFIPERRVAVEVHCAAGRPTRIFATAQKTMELLSAQISVAEVWIQVSRGEVLSEAALQELVAYVKIACPLPSGLGQYRVIRGRGDLDPVSQMHLDEFADVAVRYRRLQTGGMNED